MTVSVQIENTGNRAGAEIVQCYVQEDGCFLKQLRGFEKIFLQPGESARVSFTLTDRDFSFFSEGWKLMRDARVLIGASSRDLRLDTAIRRGESQRQARRDVAACPDGYPCLPLFFGRPAQCGIPGKYLRGLPLL